MSDPAYRAAREGVALFDAADRGKVEVTGPEAAVFLHNLTSADVKGLAYSRGAEAFFCNVQARVLAWGTIWHLKIFDDSAFVSGREAFWIDLDPGLGEKVRGHLDRHLISEQAEIFDRTTGYDQFHLVGPEAPALLETMDVKNLQPDEMMQAGFGAGTVQFRRRDRLGAPGFDVVGPVSEIASLRRRLLDAGAVPGTPETYEILRVEAGTPTYGIDLDESHLAPEVNRTAQAISYAKGCYLGQEPIVRIRDLGHVNRVLTGLRIEGEIVPLGAKLWRDGKEVGQVTSVVASPTFGTIALAYVRRGSYEPGTAVDVEAEGGRRAARVEALPFGSAPH